MKRILLAPEERTEDMNAFAAAVVRTASIGPERSVLVRGNLEPILGGARSGSESYRFEASFLRYAGTQRCVFLGEVYLYQT